MRIQVYVMGEGHGSVTSSPAGIACGTACQVNFVNGTLLTLTAVAAPGSVFAGWGGACAGNSPTCTLSMAAAGLVMATFTPPPAHLSVTKPGTGAGSVASGLPGIDCGSVCGSDVPYGGTVTLTAVPASGSTFAGWGGVCYGTATTCTVRLYEDDSVTATFTADPPVPLDPSAPASTPASPSLPDPSRSTDLADAVPAPIVPAPAGPSQVVVAPAAKARPTLRARPRLGGRARARATLTCTRGTWNGSPYGYVFVWRRAGTAVARGSRYLVRAVEARSFRER